MIRRKHTCRRFTLSLMRTLRKDGKRPTGKVVFFTIRNKEIWVLIFYSPKTGSIKFPGGGIEKHETAVTGLWREVHEEAKGHGVTRKQVMSAPIIGVGELPTKREGYVAKSVFVIALLHKQLGRIKPKSDELCCPIQMKLQAVLAHIEEDAQTPADVKKLYIRSLQELQRQHE